MKNFGTLFRYEMKKIWRQPLLWSVILLATALFGFVVGRGFLPTSQGITYTTTDLDGKEISRFLTTDAQFRIKLEGGQRLAGQVMDENFFRRARETIPMDRDRLDLEAWFLLTDPSYYQFWSYHSEFMGGTAEEYYAVRQASVDSELQRLDEESRAYWEAMEKRVETPFVYQPENGMQILYSLISSGGIALFVPLIAGACLCELFSRERRTKMDALVFSTSRGRRTLYFAKIIAGALSAVLATAMVTWITLAIHAALYGTDSWDGVIQLILPWCIWPITMGQGVLILLGLTLLFALLCGGVVAAVSVFTGNGIAAMAVSLAVMIVSSQPVQGKWGNYLPSSLINPEAFQRLDLTHLFGLQLNVLQVGALLYGGIAVVLLVLCRLGWRRWASAGQ